MKGVVATHIPIKTATVTAEIIFRTDAPTQIVLMNPSGSLITSGPEAITDLMAVFAVLTDEWNNANAEWQADDQRHAAKEAPDEPPF